MTENLKLKWDPKNIELKAKAVAKQLEPLVILVTTLVNTNEKTQKRKRGKSKKGAVLVAIVEQSTAKFIEKGEEIAHENPEITKEMLGAVEEVRQKGNVMSQASREFVDDPCSSNKRSSMVRAARNLLNAVTRLLIIADMIDVHLLLKSLNVVKDNLDKLKNVSNQDDLMKNFNIFTKNANDLINQVARRQQNFKDPQIRDDLAAARAVLKKYSTMLLVASKANVHHPDIPAAKNNRDQVLKQMCEAVDTINDIAEDRTPQYGSRLHDGPGKLAASLDAFDNQIVMDPVAYNKVRTKLSLEKLLEEIIGDSVLMADSIDAKNERRERIITECNSLREALQGLLTQYMTNVGNKERNEELNLAIDNMAKKTKDLRRQLRKAVVDKVSDNFLDALTPLNPLVEVAKNGDLAKVEECADAFTAHCKKLAEVAQMLCNISDNEEGVKMVRYAAAQVLTLCPEVINAARILAGHPQSSIAIENMDAFKKLWENQVQILTDAVDDITTIDDVLAVSENHILDDMNKCVRALQEGDVQMLNSSANDIKIRSNRICDMVTAEMDNYEPCIYTKRVMEAVKVLNDQAMPKFDQQIITAVGAISSNPPKSIDENEFIDTTRLVYEGIRDVRRAVLMNRADEDLDPEEVELDETHTLERYNKVKSQVIEQGPEENPEVRGIGVVINKLPEKEKQKILKEVEDFKSEKLTFDREVAKWDDAGNDIVVLAKYMCLIMLDMTDFVRQKGSLKTPTDVINAAKKISETGKQLDKLARQIADQCPESSTKKDLIAYLERVALYCHQINIISKVKADVEKSNKEELIITGVESATSLIENAKNLMNAVVFTVKASYVASTKYSRQGTLSSPIVVWKMKPPEKKPLVRREKPKEVRAVVRKASQKKTQNPLRMLAEFQNAETF